ncbi:AVN_HP_G0119960.mRNA.1.CDS.1 [Saccharomyces cerevisiae]|nr:AVN_HP_G0119960.mRNA.1.CDS.1 [Saccharomyces cerevisiae]CAI6997061.1 AVN_HP_G0119960.mRNA.1.CDS.1 [Saccharomyces cerevisiae]
MAKISATGQTIRLNLCIYFNCYSDSHNNGHNSGPVTAVTTQHAAATRQILLNKTFIDNW